jgi:hypothetical protein
MSVAHRNGDAELRGQVSALGDCTKQRRSARGGRRTIRVPSENLIRWIRSRKENRLMIESDGDLLQTFARIYVGLLSFA